MATQFYTICTQMATPSRLMTLRILQDSSLHFRASTSMIPTPSHALSAQGGICRGEAGNFPRHWIMKFPPLVFNLPSQGRMFLSVRRNKWRINSYSPVENAKSAGHYEDFLKARLLEFCTDGASNLRGHVKALKVLCK